MSEFDNMPRKQAQDEITPDHFTTGGATDDATERTIMEQQSKMFQRFTDYAAPYNLPTLEEADEISTALDELDECRADEETNGVENE